MDSEVLTLALHGGAIDLWVDAEPVPYPYAMERMARRVQDIQKDIARETLWFLEHPAMYTGGVRARAEHLINPQRLPVYATGRGGQYTYHGPGQRVVYVMLDLRRRGQDLRRFVWLLEEWLIQALDQHKIQAERRAGRVGLWVTSRVGEEQKIAALGVRIQKWVTSHGVALNVCPDLSGFRGIVPCGLKDFGVTSVRQYQQLNLTDPLADSLSVSALDATLIQTFHQVFELFDS